MRFPFIGPSYTLASAMANCQRTMNYLIEVDESGTGKNKLILKRTPGLKLFTTLGSGPIRGLWPGENRLFAVSGNALYEVFADGSYVNRSALAGGTTIGNDGLPVRMFPNGNQLFIVSAGQAYCDNGAGPQPVYFGLLVAGVNTSGVNVTYVSGDTFLNINPGDQVAINGTVYSVATVASGGTSLALTSSAGTQSDVTLTHQLLQGTVNTAGTAVSWVSGDTFDTRMAGAPIVIAGTTYTVASVASDGLTLTLTASAGTQTGAHYGASPLVVASQGAYLDGYFIVSEPNSKQFHLSALFDGTTWDLLDTATKEGYPDNIASILADHEELWLWGDEATTEVWQDTGAANFPFQRDPGAFIHYSCQTPFSVVRLNDGVAWIGGDQERGGPVAWFAQGFRPVRISHHAIEQVWAAYPTVADAVAYSAIEGGHHLWVINFPTGNATWVYDATASQQAGVAVWSERGWWNGTSIDRQRANSHAFVPLQPIAWSSGTTYPVGAVVSYSGGYYSSIQAGNTNRLPTVTAWWAPAAANFPQHFVGDWSNGKIYTQSTSWLDDDGTAIHRVRTAPHVANENLRVFFSHFEVMADVNSGTIAPTLDYSVDYGHAFVNPQQISSNQPGITNQHQIRLNWWRQGASRDRVYRLTIADAADFTVVDAYYEADAGYS